MMEYPITQFAMQVYESLVFSLGNEKWKYNYASVNHNLTLYKCRMTK